LPQITYVEPGGARRTVEVPLGYSVMEGALKHRIDGIIAACGGSCSCSTCHVHVEEEWLERVGPPHDAERDTLEFAIAGDRRSRLSCQIEVTEELDGLVVHVADEQA
jgi:2Fe-2S ferredoxin